MQARTKRVGEECVAKGIPFVILPANDPFALEAYSRYVELVDEANDVDNSYVEAVSSDLARMERWQDEHPEDTGPPVLMEGEN